MNLSGALAKEIRKRKKAQKSGDVKKSRVEESTAVGANPNTEVKGAQSGPDHQNGQESDKSPAKKEKVSAETSAEVPVDTSVPSEARKAKELRYKQQLDREAQVDKDILLDDIANEAKSKLLVQLRVYVKDVVKQWEQTGVDKEFLLETKKDLVVLLYKLRSDGLADDMVTSLATICYYLQHRQFQKATESYMKLSIGNIAWPIGVVGVGIHARSASSKIEDAGANIMIDDQTRRWITAVKRLITFMEKNNDKTGNP